MSLRVFIDDAELHCESGGTLFDCAETLDVRVPTSCNKNGKCRECLVEVEDGMECLSSRSREEEHLDGRFRLSCRAKLRATDGVVRCHTLRRGELRIEDRFYGNEFCGNGASVNLDPAVRRRGDDVFVHGRCVGRSAAPLRGLAMDLGTTTVVVRLVDLESGRIEASQSFENPQRFGGSDVMARIQYDGARPGRLLQRTLLGYLGHAIQAFGVDTTTIYDVVVAGNTTMRDLLFGLDVQSIGQSPYQSLIEREVAEGTRQTTALSVEARRLRLPVHPEAEVYSLPLVRGHIGADAAAGLLAVGFPHDGTVAFMDIGTNTELVVGRGKHLFAASCPAGPAFEGGGVRCGMPGLEGAVEAVSLTDGRGDVESCRVIGGGAPRGICGSGLIDLLSELLRTERMDHLGRLADDADRFVVDAARGIDLSEADISELAQAKGANVAGLGIVLEVCDIDWNDIDTFYLAGGFARHLDIAAARRIGLIPDLPDGRIRQVGNAAIEGATQALLSVSERRRIESLVAGVEHVELEIHESFFDHFVDGCQFIPFGGGVAC